MPRNSVTLKEILNRLMRTTARVELFGVTREFEKIYEVRLARLSEAICLEMGIKKSHGDDPMHLPESTKFTTTRVVKAYQRLCDWLDAKRQSLEPEAET